MIKKLLCKLGFHNWSIVKTMEDRWYVRKCDWCKKQETHKDY